MAFSVAMIVFTFCFAVVAISSISGQSPPPVPASVVNTTGTNATSNLDAIPSPPFSCYDCNSGSPLPDMWSNNNCNESGYVAPWYTPSPCSTLCFASVGLYPAGTVFRGCAANLYVPDRAMVDGCFEDTASQRVVCLCSGDECNTMDLTQASKYYVDEYEYMQKVKEDKKANSVQ